jgi:endoglycosylceramidase
MALGLATGACIALLLGLLAPGAPAARPVLPAPASLWAPGGFIGAPGGLYLVDARGRRLELHGADMAAKCGGGAQAMAAAGSPCVGPAAGPHLPFVLSPSARDPGRRFTAADATSLARLGFNFVRLGMIWEGLEPGPAGVEPNNPAYCSPHTAGTPFPALGSADPYRAAVVRAYLARTDTIVKLLARAGIRVLLDMHQDVYSSVFSSSAGPTPWNGEGAPAWATCTGNAHFGAPGYWGHAYGDPAVKVAIHHFFANDVSGDLQGQFTRVWTAVARHYRTNPNVIGYEIYNEPEDASVQKFDRELQCFYGGPLNEPRSCAASGSQASPRGVIGAIQSADPRHVVVYEPSVNFDFNQALTVGISEPLRFRRLALAFHAYSSNQVLTIAAAVQQRGMTRTRQPGGPALLMDEFGGNRHAASAGATADLADALGVSWSYWSALELHDPTGNPREGLLDEQTGRPSPQKARALSEAYPAATAGTPGPVFFDRATGAFAYRYVVDRRVHAPTEIELPRSVYPRGYRVQVRGALVRSARNATVLELQPRPRAWTVSVTVRRP